ncbi:hypothetical protein BCR33DRAFT_723248 [Rhizoclosmatium globosum]|uniref:Uncharacterized protein n=1 Tax=Rhizoclosmatium globosum TaxID=329046 RepID=A0A1Y2BEL2_9FUNG|nr:hypothetical protein BCR33DRAFT_723248 [Rhizoclosmatium globosum]|eukprot:ORY33273.1 hypothetical protein BCR33DRAFT_723248 [Rhizoclosmatium globosum]
MNPPRCPEHDRENTKHPLLPTTTHPVILVRTQECPLRGLVRRTVFLLSLFLALFFTLKLLLGPHSTEPPVWHAPPPFNNDSPSLFSANERVGNHSFLAADFSAVKILVSGNGLAQVAVVRVPKRNLMASVYYDIKSGGMIPGALDRCDVTAVVKQLPGSERMELTVKVTFPDDLPPRMTNLQTLMRVELPQDELYSFVVSGDAFVVDYAGPNVRSLFNVMGRLGKLSVYEPVDALEVMVKMQQGSMMFGADVSAMKVDLYTGVGDIEVMDTMKVNEMGMFHTNWGHIKMERLTGLFETMKMSAKWGSIEIMDMMLDPIFAEPSIEMSTSAIGSMYGNIKVSVTGFRGMYHATSWMNMVKVIGPAVNQEIPGMIGMDPTAVGQFNATASLGAINLSFA